MTWALAILVSVSWVALVPLGPVVLSLTPEHGIHLGDALVLIPISFAVLRERF